MSKCFHGSSLDHQNPKSQLAIRLIGGPLGQLFLSPGGLALTSLVDGDKAVMSAIGQAPHFDTRCIAAFMPYFIWVCTKPANCQIFRPKKQG